jgi:hypothetical protein
MGRRPNERPPVRTRLCSRITILTRSGQCLAAATLTAALAFAAAPIARAEWDIEAYDKCIATNGEGYAAACCGFSGGVWHKVPYPGHGGDRCEAAVFQSAPPPPPPPKPGPPALAPNQGHSP